MASPVCIKLHKIKMVKIKYEGTVYEIAASSFGNLLSDFQKHKPEVKQLLLAQPLVEEDFDNLTEESIVYASGDTMSMTGGRSQPHSGAYYSRPTQLDHQNRLSNQNDHFMAIPFNPTTLPQPGASKLRSDLSMVDSFCPPPSAPIEVPPQTEPIDTADVARHVRDVLQRHGISQRLFSKYVVKRSQGRVSYLLRCPKQWERMREWGRVPYRRMKAWLEGDIQQNIQVLLQIKQDLDLDVTALMTQKCHDEYLRADDSEELDNGNFSTRSEHYEASGFREIKTEQEPIMVSSTSYDQD